MNLVIERKSAAGDDAGDDPVREIRSAIEGYDQATRQALDELRAEVKAARKRADDVELKLNRRGLGGGELGASAAGDYEKRALLEDLGRIARGAQPLEAKAWSISDDSQGGYLVPATLSPTIRERVAQFSPIRRYARVIPLAAGDRYEEPNVRDLPAAAWVSETGNRGQTATPNVGMTMWPLHERFANAPVTQKMLDTSPYDVANTLIGLLAKSFAVQEGQAFLNGTGVGQPSGILSFYPSAAVDDRTRDWSTLEYVASGDAATVTADSLVTITAAVKPEFLPNARWFMSRRTAATVRKLKDGQGRFIFIDPLTAGGLPLLLGHEVVLCEDMPDVGAGAVPIIFGDMSAYYIVEQPTMRLLRDPYSAKPFVLFYAYHRVGGGMADMDALKLLKIGTS